MNLFLKIIIVVSALFISYLTHEFRHYIYDYLFSECKPKLIFRINGIRTGLVVQAEIPEEIIPIIRKNPSKFVVNRNISRAVGIVGIIPQVIASLLFPDIKLAFDVIIYVLFIYSLWETAFLNHDYLNAIFVEKNDSSNILE